MQVTPAQCGRVHFDASSLIRLVHNLAERLHNNKSTDCKSCFEYIKFEDTNLIFKCLKSNKSYK